MIRFTFPRFAGVLVAALLVGYTFFLAPKLAHVRPTAAAAHAGGSGSTDDPPKVRPGRKEFPVPDKAFLGVATAEGAHDFAPVDAFAKATARKPSVLLFTEGWAVDHFKQETFDQVAKRGMMPMLSWEPWDYRAPVQADKSRSNQSRYALSRIINGEFDAYIRSYADGIRGLDYQVAIRFAHEMNGFWYPWSEQANGNRPGEYVQMWRHVHDIFKRAGVTNVLWVWSANVSYANSGQLSALYPGDDQVDWIGLSGYYGTEGHEQYQSFQSVFEPTFNELRRFSRKPLVLTEVGATDSAGRRADWIRDMFATLPRRPDVIGVIWFEAVRELDWRLAKTPVAAAAYAAAAADPRYAVTWTRDSVGRLEVTIPEPPPSAAPTSKAPNPPPARTTTPARPNPPRHTPTKAPTVAPTKPQPTPEPTTPPTTPEPTPTP